LVESRRKAPVGRRFAGVCWQPCAVIDAESPSDVSRNTTKPARQIKRLIGLYRYQGFLQHARETALKTLPLTTDEYSPVALGRHKPSKTSEASLTEVDIGYRFRGALAVGLPSDRLSFWVEADDFAKQA
jgi:hypothetical protein